MANRVTPDELREIIETDKDDPILETFITTANLLVTKLLASTSALSDAERKEIEKWLAAHFLACTLERQGQSETADRASISYQGKTDMGLDATLYGQQVKLLDTTGLLSASVGKRQASMYAITSFK